jgi:hypothetical protein
MLSRAGSPLSMTNGLTLTIYENENLELDNGCSNPKSLETGAMDYLQCYGAPEIVCYLSITHRFIALHLAE